MAILEIIATSLLGYIVYVQQEQDKKLSSLDEKIDKVTRLLPKRWQDRL